MAEKAKVSEDLTTKFITDNANLFTKLTDDIVKYINENLYNSKEVNTFSQLDLSKSLENDKKIVDESNKKTIG